MTTLRFPFDKSSSDIFGYVYRPMARVDFWSRKIKRWVEVIMIVDTGADYTLLPGFYAMDLGIDLKRECSVHWTGGIGGREKVYLFRGAQVRLGKWKRLVPVGFLDRDDIPPLLGRQDFLETFKVTLVSHYSSFAVAPTEMFKLNFSQKGKSSLASIDKKIAKLDIEKNL